MERINMNTQLGTGWFTFYTKVRPWITCFFAISFWDEFLQYTNVYLEKWWLVIYALFAIALQVLGIMVFIKSRGDYDKFVPFVTGVLFFETVSMPYQLCVQQYIRDGLSGSDVLVFFAFNFALSFFLWFRLNVKYFERRRIKTTTNEPSQIENPCEVTVNHYCINCGSKLAENSNFCGNCGAKVIRE